MAANNQLPRTPGLAWWRATSRVRKLLSHAATLLFLVVPVARLVAHRASVDASVPERNADLGASSDLAYTASLDQVCAEWYASRRGDLEDEANCTLCLACKDHWLSSAEEVDEILFVAWNTMGVLPGPLGSLVGLGGDFTTSFADVTPNYVAMAANTNCRWSAADDPQSKCDPTRRSVIEGYVPPPNGQSPVVSVRCDLAGACVAEVAGAGCCPAQAGTAAQVTGTSTQIRVAR